MCAVAKAHNSQCSAVILPCALVLTCCVQVTDHICTVVSSIDVGTPSIYHVVMYWLLFLAVVQNLFTLIASEVSSSNCLTCLYLLCQKATFDY